uniref:Venom peptide n=1 Tax=Dasymutilla chiron TaxID=374949 RepID=A0A8T9VUJ1_DASCH|nr:venom peptide precursor [Dasymutilla chiron]
MKRSVVASLFIVVIVLSEYALAMPDPGAESRRAPPLPY